MKPTPAPNPFKSARNAGCPLIAIETPDPAATVIQCQKALNGSYADAPFAVWDCVNGLRGVNKAGEAYCNENNADSLTTSNPVEALAKIAANPPPKGTVFLSNAHLVMEMNREPSLPAIQAIWNLRNIFEATGAALVMLAPSFRLPAELSRDVVLITEPLPTADEFSALIDSVTADANVPKPADQERAQAVDALIGLSAFEARQTLAQSLNKTGVNLPLLWERKYKQIEQTPGLTVHRGTEKYADIGGSENAKKLIGDTIRGKLKISCIVFFDEFDKSMSAAGSDSSGTTQDQNKALLTYMQAKVKAAALFLGPAGTGKTLLATAAGNEYGIPCFIVDLGAAKNSLVGASEQAMRQILKIIDAVSDGRALFIAACNKSEKLPPETRRRFNYLSMFFDLPNAEERARALAVHARKYELTPDQLDWTPPQDWTGAEIHNACLKSWAMEIPLSEACRSIVPIAKSAADTVQELRKSAAGKYVSASYAGLYNPAAQDKASETNNARRMEIA